MFLTGSFEKRFSNDDWFWLRRLDGSNGHTSTRHSNLWTRVTLSHGTTRRNTAIYCHRYSSSVAAGDLCRSDVDASHAHNTDIGCVHARTQLEWTIGNCNIGIQERWTCALSAWTMDLKIPVWAMLGGKTHDIFPYRLCSSQAKSVSVVFIT